MPLDPADVRLWLAFPDQASETALESFAAVLSAEETARMNRFHFPEDRRLYLTAHALVRRALSCVEPGVSPERWRFVAGPHGRPEIVPGLATQPLRFNLSHTRGLAACAITVGRDVGIDVECLAKRVFDADLACRIFSGDEMRALEALPEVGRHERFYCLWTLRESYMKARGLGLALPLDQFSFDLDARDPAGTDVHGIRILLDDRVGDRPDSWHFELWRPAVHHRLALAVRRAAGETLRVRFEPSLPGFGDA